MAGVIVDTRGLARSEQNGRGSAEPEAALPDSDRPELGGALEALSGEILKKRSLEISSTSFVTIISIILGVALALLAEKTFPFPRPLVAAQSACMLLLFVCTFYYFLSISIILRWAPSFADCAQPFIITSLEIPPTYFLGRVTGWDACLAILFVFVAAGVGSTVMWSPVSHFGGDRKAQRMLHRIFREVAVIFGTGALSLASIGLAAHFAQAGKMWWGFGSCAVVLATLGALVARMEIQLSRIHAYYGVNRPPFN
ncbi:hypothetical protein [Paractinoplanes toevensis]|uniref:Uncharacterized protein n=1 Tax=Paractinoplanes toevensis TaxID=571911 RepID=A0A919T8P0_9ACTN|nr:hypothetical protein [Actinoplanes toevensis]GIM91163.1 hypothetical protein Ato02nite_029560 [Actinoplanes toevensis]